ncbi:hypothetical protein [Streptomyces cavernicola]|uniref:FHA domain-containing protein n=1 Tax=Streptomyces cavernicola TaxID=3043613 RepID=A0ABT6SCG9_9ACTN|nr:hypothetical protein [Streptomyces sp. B-S-A6]MDI3405891.1 hypothetical protein [Streptomyces sp. B-S-A6]
MLELTMASVSAEDTGATAGMLMADEDSAPGAVLRVGRDGAVCRLVPPEDWLFVSRAHLEFRCGPDLAWGVTWLKGSHPDPSSRVRLVTDGGTLDLPYGGTEPLPAGGSGEVIIEDRTSPRSVNVGFHHEA